MLFIHTVPLYLCTYSSSCTIFPWHNLSFQSERGSDCTSVIGHYIVLDSFFLKGEMGFFPVGARMDAHFKFWSNAHPGTLSVLRTTALRFGLAPRFGYAHSEHGSMRFGTQTISYSADLMCLSLHTGVSMVTLWPHRPFLQLLEFRLHPAGL